LAYNKILRRPHWSIEGVGLPGIIPSRLQGLFLISYSKLKANAIGYQKNKLTENPVFLDRKE
jgi:hypothetical protein